ncbi:MAG: CapA family protein [Candidatus Dojkabacteria bacterium]
MLNIQVSEKMNRREPKKRKIPFFKIFIFALFLNIVALFFLEKGDFLSAFSYIFLTKKNITVYQTYTVLLDDTVPTEFKDIVKSSLEDMEFNGKKRFEFVEKNADITISKDNSENSSEVFSKDMIPVGHMYSLVNGIEQKDLKSMNWYMVDGKYKEYLENQNGLQITVLDSYDSFLSKLEEDDENVGLVELKDLDYRVKVLEVGGKYYLDSSEGGIAIRFYATMNKGKDDFIFSVLKKNIDLEGGAFDRGKLSKVNMSGVVAISRGLASKMDRLGSSTYPADEIGEFLANADLTHVSNEVSFLASCTVYSGMRFCAKPKYIDVLKKSGVDIVELTGNHNNDFGSDANADSIKMYTDLGMRYFGGGLNTEDSEKILYEEVKGTKIAFMGYNWYDTMYGSLALAGEDRAGANSYSEEKLADNIKEAKANADIVIVDFQFQECYSYPSSDVVYPICYKPLSSPDQKSVFKKAIDLGANIVIGTQAHQPQTFELYKDGVIFYGLGNLFFDQNIWIGTRQGLVLSHYFYEGKHIQTRVVPIYMDKELKVRVATKEQGDLLLKLLKNARD